MTYPRPAIPGGDRRRELPRLTQRGSIRRISKKRRTGRAWNGESTLSHGNKSGAKAVPIGMAALYRILADTVVVVHASYVAFVVFGQIAILFGLLRRWEWIRNLPFRLTHLAAIVVVVLESWCRIPCPLTTWENWLRDQAADVTYAGDFVANCVHHVLFYQAEPWVFTTCYSVFGALVLLTFVMAPPRHKPRPPTPAAG
jgi:hypothetical protein